MSWRPPLLDDMRLRLGTAPLPRSHVAALCLASLAIFVLSCALPALQMHSEGSSVIFPGLLLLVYGWGGVTQLQFAWCANLALPLAVLLLLSRRWVPAAVVAAVGLLIGSDTFALFFQPAGVAGAYLSLTMPLIGFYFWMASFAVLLATAVVGARGSVTRLA